MTAGEERQHPRALSFDLVKVRSEVHPQAEEVTNVWDISAGGLRFATGTLLHANDPIRIILNMTTQASSRTIEAGARVAWIARGKSRRYYVAGVEFTDIGTGDRAFIRADVERRRAEH